jgi:hypothetical protein
MFVLVPLFLQGLWAKQRWLRLAWFEVVVKAWLTQQHHDLELKMLMLMIVPMVT